MIRLLHPRALGGATAAVVLLAVVVVPWRFRLRAAADWDADDAAAALEYLRRSWEADAELPPPPALESRDGRAVPMVLTQYAGGRLRHSWQVTGAPAGEALRSLAASLRETPLPRERRRPRLELAVITGTGWLPARGPLFAMAFVEGHDGFAALVGGVEVLVPPSDLVRTRSFESYAPAGRLEKGLRVGVSAPRAADLLLSRADAVAIPRGEIARPRRIRAITVVEGHDLRPLRLLKATTERPGLTPARLQAAVLAGAEYLVRGQDDGGRFRYVHEPVADQWTSSHYSWRRHSGVCYGLALVGHLLDEPHLVEAAGRGLDAQDRRLARGPDGSLVMRRSRGARLGDAAVALLAVSVYREASGDTARDRQARRLAAFLRSQQRDDGFFEYDWTAGEGPHTSSMRAYEVQEALMALATYGRVFDDGDALDAAELGMDYLSGPYWPDHFLGRFFVAQEHWTCMAAEELYRTRPHRDHAAFCHHIGEVYAAMALDADGTAFAEDAGGVGFGHVMSPHMGATATVVEAMVAAVTLGEAEGMDTEDMREQLLLTMQYLVGCQITVDDVFWIRHPRRALGGLYDSRSRPHTRMDNVQHAITGMARALALLPPPDPAEVEAALAAYDL